MTDNIDKDELDDSKLTDEEMKEVQDYDRDLNLHYTSVMDSFLQKNKSEELQRLRQEERSAEAARLQGLQDEKNLEAQQERQEAQEKAREYWNNLEGSINRVLKEEAKAYDSFETGMMKLFLMSEDFGQGLRKDLEAAGVYQGINAVVGGLLKSPYTVPAYLGKKLLGGKNLRERNEDAKDAKPELTDQDRYLTTEPLSSRLEVNDDTGELTIREFTPQDGEPKGFVTHSDGSKEEMTLSQMANEMLKSGLQGLLHKNGWVEMPGESGKWVSRSDTDTHLTKAALDNIVKNQEWNHHDIKAFSESFQREMDMKPPEPVNDKTDDLDNEDGIELGNMNLQP